MWCVISVTVIRTVVTSYIDMVWVHQIKIRCLTVLLESFWNTFVNISTKEILFINRLLLLSSRLRWFLIFYGRLLKHWFSVLDNLRNDTLVIAFYHISRIFFFFECFILLHAIYLLFFLIFREVSINVCISIWFGLAICNFFVIYLNGFFWGLISSHPISLYLLLDLSNIILVIWSTIHISNTCFDP